MNDTAQPALPGMSNLGRSVCGEPGCGKELRCDNISGFCGSHRETKAPPVPGFCGKEGCGKQLRGVNITGYCRAHQSESRQPYMLAGEIHNRWVTLESVRGAADKVLCRCECGTVRPVNALSLRRETSRSCGCIVGTFHGLRKHPAADSWYAMISRCTKTSSPSYHNYGGRGITVCDRWSGPEGLANFIADMWPKPDDEYTLDRIDNDGPYSQENCRWASRSAQQFNRRPITTNAGRDELLAENARLRAEVDRLRGMLRALDIPVAA